MAHNAATQVTQPQQPDTLFSRGKKQVLIFTSVWIGYLIAYFIFEVYYTRCISKQLLPCPMFYR